MNTETVQSLVGEAMDAETFVLEDFLDDLPIAEHKVEFYTNLPKSRRLHELMEERKEALAKRREADKKGKASDLSLTDADEDTEYDEEINELVEELEKTKLTFELVSVAPELRKSINKHYEATAPKGGTEEEIKAHSEKGAADVLRRAISRVILADGRVDDSEWTPERLLKLEQKLYEQQGQKLIGALWDMIYTGEVFEEAMTTDFS